MESMRSSATGSQLLLKAAALKNDSGTAWYRRRKWVLVLFPVVVVLAVILPVYFLVIKKNGGGSSGPDGGSSLRIGGNGSVVTLENGTQFTYLNEFGGFWVDDPSDPFPAYAARPNSWTPPLNVTWDWGKDKVYGVNLGGLFVLEPFITPDLFQRFNGSRDEYELSVAMREGADGGIGELEEHYKTFITEEDIAEIAGYRAGAGLNWIRIPIGFWAIETWDDEPFLAKVSWSYMIKVLGWARKYGLRVCLDLHAIPGSQNGYNHSGRLSPVNFLNGNMGLANAQRALYYIRVFTEFISQPEYRLLVPIWGIVNEALVGVIGMDQITSFYLEAHDLIRGITGYGEGNGPYIAIHEAFLGLQVWENFLEGSDRFILDQHPYFSFGGVFEDPIATEAEDGLPGGIWPKRACDSWGPGTNTSQQNFGITIAAEFAASPNDCGLFLKGVGAESTNTQCSIYNDWRNYNDTMREGILNFVTAEMDALVHWFFWTWKIGPSGVSGKIETPLWSYQLGLRNGWIPKDPRTVKGKCQRLGTPVSPFNGTYAPWQTGNVTSDSIPASSREQYPWPPATISGADVPVSLMPTYTATGAVATLTAGAVAETLGVDGWFDDGDTAGGVVPVKGKVAHTLPSLP
uniref:glucan 1,3-beta-glucosidase n=1 Tax=Flammulina velutipes TaxID=38945 RepID=G8A531_FLAVE|nr:putative cellulase/exo-1,3-beta-glucanase [Flammulina velutipes]